MDWFLEPFMLGFQQRALIGGLVAGLMSSMVGVWLVLRGMSWGRLRPRVLPGIAAAVLFDFPFLGASIAAMVMVGGIEFIHARRRCERTPRSDCCCRMMALGVAIISKSRTYTGSLTEILFGTPSVSVGRTSSQSAIAAFVVAGSIVLYRPLLVLSFSSRKALTRDEAVTDPRVKLAMIAAAVIGSFQAGEPCWCSRLWAARRSPHQPQHPPDDRLVDRVVVVAGLARPHPQLPPGDKAPP